MKKLVLLALFFATFFQAKAQYTKLLDFGDSTNGVGPLSNLYSDGTFLYGMTYVGGTWDDGTIFKIKPDGTGYSTLFNFQETISGKRPNGSLVSDGTFLYGVTSWGGVNSYGTLFKIKPDGTGFSTLFNFPSLGSGAFPIGTLVYDGTSLYGMTQAGGTGACGTVYRISKYGTGYLTLVNFSGPNGWNPNGSLFYDGTDLYGMTRLGGTDTNGVIFKVKTNGTGFSKLLDFDGVTNGANPCGSFFSDGTYLYGMTQHGGANDLGVVFKIMTNGTGYSKLMDFAGISNGNDAQGTLVSDGTFLYGMTDLGGADSMGTFFKIKPDGTGYAKLLDFSGSTNGSSPHGDVIFDGTFFYGMTYKGGINSRGTIFKFREDLSGINENNSENIFSLYPNPSNGIFTVNSKITSGEISIYNTLGEIVYESQIINQNTEIDLTDKPNGIYFINIKTETEFLTQKIIIQK